MSEYLSLNFKKISYQPQMKVLEPENLIKTRKENQSQQRRLVSTLMKHLLNEEKKEKEVDETDIFFFLIQ